MAGPGWRVAGLALTSIPMGTTAPGEMQAGAGGVGELEGWASWWGTGFETRLLGWLSVPGAAMWAAGWLLVFWG